MDQRYRHWEKKGEDPLYAWKKETSPKRKNNRKDKGQLD